MMATTQRMIVAALAMAMLLAMANGQPYTGNGVLMPPAGLPGDCSTFCSEHAVVCNTTVAEQAACPADCAAFSGGAGTDTDVNGDTAGCRIQWLRLPLTNPRCDLPNVCSGEAPVMTCEDFDCGSRGRWPNDDRLAWRLRSPLTGYGDSSDAVLVECCEPLTGFFGFLTGSDQAGKKKSNSAFWFLLAAFFAFCDACLGSFLCTKDGEICHPENYGFCNTLCRCRSGYANDTKHSAWASLLISLVLAVLWFVGYVVALASGVTMTAALVLAGISLALAGANGLMLLIFKSKVAAAAGGGGDAGMRQSAPVVMGAAV